jgi:hypothetical protein
MHNLPVTLLFFSCNEITQHPLECLFCAASKTSFFFSCLIKPSKKRGLH